MPFSFKLAAGIVPFSCAAGSIAAQIARGVRENCIRHRSQLLARSQRAEHARAIRSHANFHPVRTAHEHTRPEIYHHREQAITHRSGVIGHWPNHRDTSGVDTKQREGQVVIAIGGHRAVVESALISEGGSLAAR